ncbi:unnamed protein product [Amaranthus hypochondriacus]
MILTYSFTQTLIFNSIPVILLFVLVLGWATRPSQAYQTFGFDLHHRFSDPVTRILDSGEKLPEKGSIEYYAALANRDVAVHGRRLKANSGDYQTPLTFSNGNTTYRISLFGFLHYANVTVGTPGSEGNIGDMKNIGDMEYYQNQHSR